MTDAGKRQALSEAFLIKIVSGMNKESLENALKNLESLLGQAADLTNMDTTQFDDWLEKACRATHAVNSAYCVSLGKDGGVIAPDWDNCPADMQYSTAIGVLNALLGKSPREMHKSWMETRISQGWIYGEVKDENKKTHPCLVEYDELDEKDRKKDELFLSTVSLCLGRITPEEPASTPTESPL